jgi:N6-adenosine-specific RNA methylase IME4
MASMYVDDLGDLVKYGQRFGTLYLDPPWRFENQGTRGSTKKHYPTMSLEEIRALPVGALAAPNAHCHIWATKDFRRAAEDLLTAWGFRYASEMVWDKGLMGMGNTYRVQTEYCLLGVRGKATRFREKNVRNILQVPRRPQHSQKPEEMRRIIEANSPGPYLELFGRSPVRGWWVFGNQQLSYTELSSTLPLCETYGRVFSAKRVTKWFCSDACKQLAYRQRVTVTEESL